MKKEEDLRSRGDKILAILSECPNYSIVSLSRELKLSNKQIRVALNYLKESGRIQSRRWNS